MALWNSPQTPRQKGGLSNPPTTPGVVTPPPLEGGVTTNQWGQRTGGTPLANGNPETRWQPNSQQYTTQPPPPPPPTGLGQPPPSIQPPGAKSATTMGDTFGPGGVATAPPITGSPPPGSAGTVGNNGYGGRVNTGTGASYNPMAFASASERYAAWAAAGYPTKDKFGNPLDTRGDLIQYGFNDQDKARGTPGAQATQWYGPNGTTYTPSTGAYGVGSPPPPPNTTPPPGGEFGGVASNPAARFSAAAPPPPGQLGGVSVASPVVTPPPGSGVTPGPKAGDGTNLSLSGNNDFGGATGVGGQPPPPGTGTPPPPAPSGANPENHDVNDANYFINRLTNGGQLPPNGQVGQNANNSIAQQAFNASTNPPPINPALGRWVRDVGSEGGEGSYHFEGSEAYKALLGRGYTQIANDDGSVPRDGRILDWSLVTYDPQFGLVTPIGNIHLPYDHGNELFTVVAAVLGGAVAQHIMATGGGLGAGTGSEIVGPPETPPGDFVGPPANQMPIPGGTDALPPLPHTEVPGLPPPPPGMGTPPGGGNPFNNPLINNPVTRGLIGTGVNAALGTGSGTPGGGNPTGRTPGVGDAINWSIDQRDIDSYRNRVDDYVNRGDFNSQNRPGMLARYNDFLTHPEHALNDPGFVAMKDRNLGNLSRQYNARGLAISGNEMGGLQERGDELNYKHYNEQMAELRAGIGLGDPSGMARAGINSLGPEYQMRANHNATTGGLVNRFVNALGGTIGSFVQNLLRQNPNMTDTEIRAAIDRQIGPGAAEYPDWEQDFPDLMNTIRNSNNNNPPPPLDTGDGDGDWDWLYGPDIGD